MREKSSRKIYILLIALCVCMVFGVFMTNVNFSPTAAAEGSTYSSAEDSLTFTPYNNGTEYRVAARNKQVTRVKISENITACQSQK